MEAIMLPTILRFAEGAGLDYYSLMAHGLDWLVGARSDGALFHGGVSFSPTV